VPLETTDDFERLADFADDIDIEEHFSKLKSSQKSY
jgi:hypothetical protein